MATQSIDVAHSEIGFVARHMVFSKVRGQFKTWKATLDYNAADPTKSKVEVEVDTASIDTREGDRDKHLRSADFLDTEKFPKMTFKSKRIERAGEGKFKLAGDLTIRGATHEATFDVEATGGGADPWGNQRSGFSAKGSILRSQWGLTWNQALETGGLLVSDKIDIEIEVEVVHGKG